MASPGVVETSASSICFCQRLNSNSSPSSATERSRSLLRRRPDAAFPINLRIIFSMRLVIDFREVIIDAARFRTYAGSTKLVREFRFYVAPSSGVPFSSCFVFSDAELVFDQRLLSMNVVDP